MAGPVAIATCAPLLADGFDVDRPLIDACERFELPVTLAVWSDPRVDWTQFALTVIRSTWDYTLRQAEFLAWVAAVPRLHNPAPVVIANSDKTYLRDLIDAGLPVVPTNFVTPGQPLTLPTTGEFVIKPSVGAGSRGAGRFDADRDGEAERARAHAEALHAAGRTLLVQPYLTGIDTAGESALVFIDGRFSHSIRKDPLLPVASGFAVDGPPVLAGISARTADPAEIQVATEILDHLSRDLDEPMLYARIDLLPTSSGPALVEAELTEPNLFLDYDLSAADRLAEAIQARVGRR